MTAQQMRSSQLITTFGPGAMVDLPEASVIVAGLDNWKYDLNRLPVIDEPRLVEKLKQIVGSPQLALRAPPPAAEVPGAPRESVTVWRFPEWFIVQNTGVTASGARRRRLVHLNGLEKGRFRDRDDKRYSVVPIRFVRACTKGHVGDVDWKAFAHGAPSTCARDMWVEERGTTGDLDEIWITCDCGANRAMSQAARLELQALGRCNGARPWLGPGTKEACGEPNRLLIRSASNAYFPQLMSVISIPDMRSPVDDVVRSLWEDFLVDVENSDGLMRARKKPTVAQKLMGLDDATVMASIQRVRVGSGGLDRPVKEVEFDALAEAKNELGADVPEGDFFARAMKSVHWGDVRLEGKIERVVLVHRLREVIAQVGFTRFEAAGPDINGELSLNVKRAPLGLDTTWLPAVENRGEGIFLQFSEAAIRNWLNQVSVKRRGNQLIAGFHAWKSGHEGSNWEFPGLPYYLLHSFAHQLLTAVSLECGYPASSLRERVYAMPSRYGVLIYTGSSDAEGTLGGLVLAGREIGRHVRRALEFGALCSNDPVCAYHSPEDHDFQPLLGAACHGCLLIAETSCEQRNEFLDRALVVSTVENLGAEFFR